MIPSPETELEYLDPFQLLVAVILSAQCTDERVNMVTPRLFEAYPDAVAMAEALPEDLFPYIRSVTYPNNKSKHLVGAAKTIINDFDGHVPDDVPDLVKLPGVGRKTAQVVASVVFDRDALPVDTHVFRVANRLGIVSDARTPLAVERQLKKVIRKEEWSEAHHLLILHGRYTCLARKPKCEQCEASPACLYFERLQRLPEPMQGLEPSAGKYYCATCRRYSDTLKDRRDRYGVEQAACRSCKSMNVFETRSGKSTKRVPDFRVNG
jgi:endonuclease-3